MAFDDLSIDFLPIQLASEFHACSVGSRCSWCFVAQRLSGRNSPAGKWIIWYCAFISWKRLLSLSLFERDLLICRFIHLSLADDVIPIFFRPELQPAVGYGGRHYLGPSDLRLIRTKGRFWARERQAELQRPWRVGGRNTGWQPVAAGGLWEWNQGDGNRHTGATVRKMSPVGEGIHGLLQQRQRHFQTIQRRRTMPSQGIPHWSISIICLVIDWLIDWLIVLLFFLSKVFKANSDRDSIVHIVLSPPVVARYIRINPTKWNVSVAMRVEFRGCRAGILGHSRLPFY